MWWIIAISYLLVGIITAASIMAYIIKEKRKEKKPETLTDDDVNPIVVGAILWPIAISLGLFFGLVELLSKIVLLKCELCGTTNADSAMHCSHCGNMLKGKIGD